MHCLVAFSMQQTASQSAEAATSNSAKFTTERQPVLRPAVAFSKTDFKHKSIQIKGNFSKFTSHLYFKRIMYYAGLLFCSVYCRTHVYMNFFDHKDLGNPLLQ